MNLLENFVNKFSLEQKTTFNFNDINNNNENSSISRCFTNTKTKHTAAAAAPSTSPKCFNLPACYMDSNSNSHDHLAYPSCSGVSGQSLALYSDTAAGGAGGVGAIGSASVSSQSTNKKGMRNMFSFNQIEILENIFEQTHYPDSTMREKLSAHLGINSSRIQVWFQNRRAKFRKFDMKSKKSGGKFVSQRKTQELMSNFVSNSSSYETDDNKNTSIDTNDLHASYLASSATLQSSANTNHTYSDSLIYTNYLKTTSQYAAPAQPAQPAPLSPLISVQMQSDDQMNSYYMNDSNYATTYHTTTTGTGNQQLDLYSQKQFNDNRIQTLYPNTATYQFYAHYQGDNNF